MRRWLGCAMLLAFLVAVTPPAEALNPFFATVKAGQSSLDEDLVGDFGALIDGEDESYALGIGARFGKYVVFQAEYQDLGTVSAVGPPCLDPEVLCIALAAPLEADSTAVSVSFLPHFPLTERVSLFGKLGYVSWDSELSAVQEAGERFFESFEREDALYGGGLRVALPGPVGVFLEYERLTDVFEMISVGATFGF